MLKKIKSLIPQNLFKKQLKVWMLQSDPKRIVQSNELANAITTPINIIRIFDPKHQLEELKNSKNYPDFVIGCGRECFETLLEIKNFTNGKSKIIAILEPTSDNYMFDYVITPSYEPHGKDANIIETKGLINFVNKKYLQHEIKSYEQGARHRQIKKLAITPPFIAVMIGGVHTGGNVTTHDAEKLAKTLNEMAKQYDATLLISSSARTEAKTIEILEANLTANYFLYDYKFGRTIDNPYGLFLALANQIVVTGDSVRMMSEVCSSGKKVYIYDSEEIGFQYKGLSKELVAEGYAEYFTLDNVKSAKNKNEIKSLNEAERVAKIIINNSK